MNTISIRVFSLIIALSVLPAASFGNSPAGPSASAQSLQFSSNGCPVAFVNSVESKARVRGYLPNIQPELSEAGLPGDWGEYNIAPRSGVNVIRFSGSSTGGPDQFCRMRAYLVRIPISPNTRLRYWLYPQEDNARFVGVELHCSDGSRLTETKATDERGFAIDPVSGHGPLPINAWSQVTCDIGKWMSGKTIDQIQILYHRVGVSGQYRGYLDDIVVANGPIPDDSSLARTNARNEPGWLRSAVIYEVNTPKFSSSGNFAGVTAQLGRLRSLGVNIVWLMPINPVGQVRAFGSPYCVRDYYGINPKYGTARDLATLIDTAHRLDMRLILDVALDHTSWDNKLVAKHPDWYRHSDENLTSQASIIGPPMGWTDVAELDYTKPAVRSYVMSMLGYWVRTYGIDGFRFDAAELIPTGFWNETRLRLNAIHPGLILLGESHRPDLMKSAFDIDYAMTGLSAMDDVILKHRSATEVRAAWEHDMASFPAHSLHMRYSENNDLQQAVVRYGEAGARAVAALDFTLDGVPMLYNGMEVGDRTKGNFIDPGAISWNAGNAGLNAFYTRLISLRQRYKALQTGTLDWVSTSDPAQVVCYRRKGGKEKFLVVVNLSNQSVACRLDVPSNIRWVDITPGFQPMHMVSCSLSSRASLAPYGFRILETRAQ